MTLETVEGETPACLATSLIVADTETLLMQPVAPETKKIVQPVSQNYIQQSGKKSFFYI
jgi:hypothetical protein